MKFFKRLYNFYLNCETNLYKTVQGMFKMRFLTWVAVTWLVYSEKLNMTGMEYVLFTSVLIGLGVHKKIKEMEHGLNLTMEGR